MVGYVRMCQITAGVKLVSHSMLFWMYLTFLIITTLGENTKCLCNTKILQSLGVTPAVAEELSTTKVRITVAIFWALELLFVCATAHVLDTMLQLQEKTSTPSQTLKGIKMLMLVYTVVAVVRILQVELLPYRLPSYFYLTIFAFFGVDVVSVVMFSWYDKAVQTSAVAETSQLESA